jgi:hypothetical protein
VQCGVDTEEADRHVLLLLLILTPRLSLKAGEELAKQFEEMTRPVLRAGGGDN